MLFLASKLLWDLVAPGSLVLIALVGASVGLRRAPRTAAWAVRSVTVVLVAIAVLPIGSGLSRPLEERFPAIDHIPCAVDGIVLLGGSIDPVASAERDAPELRQSAERVFEFIRLARRHPGARLVFTGGTGSVSDPDVKEAPWARRLLADLGLSGDRLIFESESRNTYENALLSKRIVEPDAREHWLVVTSAMHVPRAVGVFRRIGWSVTPVPVDFRSSRSPMRTDVVGLERGLVETAEALHEWVGLVAYRLLDRTSELLPAPGPLCGALPGTPPTR